MWGSEDLHYRRSFARGLRFANVRDLASLDQEWGKAIGADRDPTAGLVVTRLGRLATSVIMQEQLLVEMRRLGGITFSCSEEDAATLSADPQDPERRLIREVLGAVTYYEASGVAQRLRRQKGRKGRAQRRAGTSPKKTGWASV